MLLIRSMAYHRQLPHCLQIRRWSRSLDETGDGFVNGGSLSIAQAATRDVDEAPGQIEGDVGRRRHLGWVGLDTACSGTINTSMRRLRRRVSASRFSTRG